MFSCHRNVTIIQVLLLYNLLLSISIIRKMLISTIFFVSAINKLNGSNLKLQKFLLELCLIYLYFNLILVTTFSLNFMAAYLLFIFVVAYQLKQTKPLLLSFVNILALDFYIQTHSQPVFAFITYFLKTLLIISTFKLMN